VCQAYGWDGPGTPMRAGDCGEQRTGRWTCGCLEYPEEDGFPGFGTGEPRVEVEAVDCQQALQAGCGLDPETSGVCDEDHLGQCWPGDGTGEWECLCEGASNDDRVGAHAERCSDALVSACGERCENAFGACDEQGDVYAQFRCACTGDPEPEPVPVGMEGAVAGTSIPTERPGIVSCEQALGAQCGRTCSTLAGDCAAGDDGFECSCESQQAAFVAFDDVGGIRRGACGDAIDFACGGVLIAPVPTCQVGVGAACESIERVWEAGTPRPEGFLFRCECAEGDEPETTEAGACYRALVEACPEAIPDPPAPAGTGEPGARCASDADCDSALCHKGEANLEGVCSAACESEADCPKGTRCIPLHGRPGRCFVECERDIGCVGCGRDASCELLNDSVDDPLSCADRPDVAPTPDGDESGSICIPLSDHHF